MVNGILKIDAICYLNKEGTPYERTNTVTNDKEEKTNELTPLPMIKKKKTSGGE